MSELGRVNSQLFVCEAPFRIKRQIELLYSDYDQHGHKSHSRARGMGVARVCVCVCVALTSGYGPQGEGNDAVGGRRSRHQVTDR